MKLIAAVLALASVALAHTPRDAHHDGAGGLEKRATPKVYTSCLQKNQWAITFDDGPYDFSLDIQKQLKAAGAKATFYVNGNNWRCIYDPAPAAALQKAYLAGHQIASHTWSHPDIATLNASALTAEITQLNTALKKIIGVEVKMFRPPYGSYNSANLKVLQGLGLDTVIWNVDSRDADGATAAESNKIFKDWASQKPQKAGLSLDHETHKDTVDIVLPALLKLTKEKKYKLVSTAECLGRPAYKSESHKMGKRDSTWHC